MESKESQEKKIIEYLKSGRSLTPMAALRLFNCFRLASRIHSLRKKYDIKNIGEERGGKRFARYMLKK